LGPHVDRDRRLYKKQSAHLEITAQKKLSRRKQGQKRCSVEMAIAPLDLP
jgi:hypothetical protein